MQSELNTIAALQTVLGLKVEAVEDRRLKFSFSQIDANDPEATFGVSVLTKDKRFEGKFYYYYFLFKMIQRNMHSLHEMKFVLTFSW